MVINRNTLKVCLVTLAWSIASHVSGGITNIDGMDFDYTDKKGEEFHYKIRGYTEEKNYWDFLRAAVDYNYDSLPVDKLIEDRSIVRIMRIRVLQSPSGEYVNDQRITCMGIGPITRISRTKGVAKVTAQNVCDRTSCSYIESKYTGTEAFLVELDNNDHIYVFDSTVTGTGVTEDGNRVGIYKSIHSFLLAKQLKGKGKGKSPVLFAYGLGAVPYTVLETATNQGSGVKYICPMDDVD